MNEEARSFAAAEYAAGRATIDDVARLIGMTVPDALAELEEAGAGQPVDALRLTSSDRRARLALIRAERLARGGQAAADADWVLRDVIASQRLEGVDARWISAMAIRFGSREPPRQQQR